MLASRLYLRAAARPSGISLPPSAYSLGLRATNPAVWPSKRIFASTPRHRKDASRAHAIEEETQAKQPAEESPKPESTKREAPADPTKKGGLLSEQTVSNKEQRRADWRIIKDMSHYLWPKDDMGTRFRVGLSVALLVGAKVGLTYPYLNGASAEVDSCRRYSTSKSHSISRPS
jgi:ATP-binding cassette, subfamily B (MDR/TAP), member 7